LRHTHGVAHRLVAGGPVDALGAPAQSQSVHWRLTAAAARAGSCPFSKAASALNEVGVMQKLDEKRKEMGIEN